MHAAGVRVRDAHREEVLHAPERECATQAHLHVAEAPEEAVAPTHRGERIYRLVAYLRHPSRRGVSLQVFGVEL